MMQIADQIAEKKIAEIVPEIQKAAYMQAYNDFVRELSFDVTTAVDIALENGEKIFHDKRTKQVVADAVMRELEKKMNKW